jgi:hypothetical protein
MVGRHAPEKTPTNLAAGGVPATSCRACRYAHFSVRRAVHRGLMLKNQDGRTVGACGVTKRTRSAARTESPSASPTLSSTLSRGQTTASYSALPRSQRRRQHFSVDRSKLAQHGSISIRLLRSLCNVRSPMSVVCALICDGVLQTDLSVELGLDSLWRGGRTRELSLSAARCHPGTALGEVHDPAHLARTLGCS